MKKGNIILFAVLAIILLVVIGFFKFYIGTYNQIVSLDEEVSSQWAQVENQYQRRLDLVPNLVATVKGYAKHESQVFIDVSEARSKAGGVMELSADSVNDPETMKKFQEAQNSLGGALQRLLSVSENYPELKANENFLMLQDEIEGTENRLSVERKRFNDTVQTYNRFIRKFPASIIANMKGFDKKAYFAAEESAKKAPVIEF